MLTDEIQEEVLQLSDLEKIHLVEMLMDDLDIPDPDVEKLWIEESEKRSSLITIKNAGSSRKQEFHFGGHTDLFYDWVENHLLNTIRKELLKVM